MGVADADPDLFALLEHAQRDIGQLCPDRRLTDALFGLGLHRRDIARGGLMGSELLGLVYVLRSGADSVVGLLCHIRT